MTATVAASKAYDLSGNVLKEDLRDIIYDISPMETIFMSRAGRGTAKSTTHEWLTDSLASPAKNAAIEGDAFTAVARTLPARLKNYTQISRKDFEVTGTAQKVSNAGMRELMAYHTAQASKEIKRDMETGLLSDEPASAGTSVSARVSAGAEAWIYAPNHISINQSAATTTAPVSGFATSPVTDGTATAFTSVGLNSMLQQAWSMGGETDTILVGPSLYNTISAFTGIATRFRDVGSRQQAQIIGAADVYVSAFGSHNIVLSRYARSTTVFCLDMSTWEVAYLRPFQTIDVATVGDAKRKALLAEYTLVCKTPLANTKATTMS
ncbi:MAG: hypothetical protein QG592_1492 [Pseudomonadota bacterium]|nr:hypothetical protein [Pseudomonadota bacterium]